MANKKLSVGRGKKRVKQSRQPSYPRPQNTGTYKVGSELQAPSAAPETVREATAAPAPARERVRPPEKQYRSKRASGTNGAKRRSTSVSASKKKKRRKAGPGTKIARGFAVTAVLVVGVVVSIFILFKIGEIKVEGNEIYTAAQIIEASEIELGDNLYAPSSLVVQHKFDSTLPYIKSISLKHELPDTLVICVKEAKAKYAFKASTKFLLTDADLKLLEIADKLPHGAAVIEGVGLKGAEIGETAQFKDTQKGEYVRMIEKELTKNKLDNITLISVQNPVELTAVYGDQITIQFGQADELEYKCALAAKAIANVLEENKNAEGTVNVKQAPETRQAYFNPNS